MRLVRNCDPETGRRFEFQTNNHSLSPVAIARIYKERWQLELFFKALKQNLKIKTFVGTLPKALKTQIWKALIAILWLKFLPLKAKKGWSLSNLVALLRWNVFTHRDLRKWLDDPTGNRPIRIAGYSACHCRSDSRFGLYILLDVSFHVCVPH